MSHLMQCALGLLSFVQKCSWLHDVCKQPCSFVGLGVGFKRYLAYSAIQRHIALNIFRLHELKLVSY